MSAVSVSGTWATYLIPFGGHRESGSLPEGSDI